ncbi:hypothetical protein GCM10027342_49360 [Photobacterium alginatilyticum]
MKGALLDYECSPVSAMNKMKLYHLIYAYCAFIAGGKFSRLSEGIKSPQERALVEWWLFDTLKDGGNPLT